MSACAGRKDDGPRYKSVDELGKCRAGECVEAELAFRHWANAEHYRGKMIYHCTPGAELDGRQNPDVTRVVIAIHGVITSSTRGVEDIDAPPGLYQLRGINQALRLAVRDDPSLDPDTIAIIAPTFQRTDAWQPYTDEDPRVWTWPGSSYQYGWLAPLNEGFAGSVKADQVSSFEVIDEFLRAAVVKFPNLEQIVLTGHSAGGQTVHRYVWMGIGVHEHLEAEGVAIRYMPANPGGYVFPLGRRKLPPGTRATPRPGLGRNDTQGWQWTQPQGCAGYDDWGFGLGDLSAARQLEAIDYAIDNYLRPVDRKLARKATFNPGTQIWRQAARKALALQYASREVWHVQSRADTVSSFPDSCRATLQGRSRFERFSNVQEAWGMTGISTPTMHFVALDVSAPHSSQSVYGSEAGRHVLFY